MDFFKKGKKPALSGDLVEGSQVAPADLPQPDLLDKKQVMIRNDKKNGFMFLSEKLGKLGPGRTIMVDVELAWQLRVKFGIRLTVLVERDE